MNNVRLLERLLSVMEDDIVPMTRAGVATGNKIFGAAVLRKDDLSLVLAGTNNETENPLWHGEVHTIKGFHELPRQARPSPADCIFLSTHEPCSMCLSAIAWAGFDNFHYFFSHEDSRDSFAIPHDLKILKEVFGLEPGGYRAKNAYWQGFSIRAGIAALDGPDRERLVARAEAIATAYDALSQLYQDGKVGNDIPLN